MRGDLRAKDQSYVLYCLTEEQLSRTAFPLGEYSKEEVRRLAEEAGFVNAEKKERYEYLKKQLSEYLRKTDEEKK